MLFGKKILSWICLLIGIFLVGSIIMLSGKEEVTQISLESYKVDSLSIEFNNKAMELWAPMFPERVPQALTFLDSAIQIDDRNVLAYTNKLLLLQITDYTKGRDFFLEIESRNPELNIDPFYLGLMNDFYQKPQKAKGYYLEVLTELEKVEIDTLNNSEEIKLLDQFGYVYFMLGEKEKADSIFYIIDNEFTIKFREMSGFYNNPIRTKEKFLSTMFEGLKGLEQ